MNSIRNKDGEPAVVNNEASEIAARKEEHAARYIAADGQVRRVRSLVSAMHLAVTGLQKSRDENDGVTEEMIDGLMELSWLIDEAAQKMTSLYYN